MAAVSGARGRGHARRRNCCRFDVAVFDACQPSSPPSSVTGTPPRWPTSATSPVRCSRPRRWRRCPPRSDVRSADRGRPPSCRRVTRRQVAVERDGQDRPDARVGDQARRHVGVRHLRVTPVHSHLPFADVSEDDPVQWSPRHRAFRMRESHLVRDIEWTVQAPHTPSEGDPRRRSSHRLGARHQPVPHLDGPAGCHDPCPCAGHHRRGGVARLDTDEAEARSGGRRSDERGQPFLMGGPQGHGRIRREQHLGPAVSQPASS